MGRLGVLPRMDPPAFQPPRRDSMEHLSHCATLASGLRRTSKVNWGHIRQPHIHHLPLEVIATVMTSSLNSHLEAKRKDTLAINSQGTKARECSSWTLEIKGQGRSLTWLPRCALHKSEDPHPQEARACIYNKKPADLWDLVSMPVKLLEGFWH